MSVSIETLDGLKRRLTISIPSQEIEEKVNEELRNYAKKAKIDGFRPGKVPMHVVVARFSDGIREQVAQDLVRPSLAKALEEQKLTPAAMADIEPQLIEKDKDFTYTATIEVFPEIKINNFDKQEITYTEATISDTDVDNLICKLQDQHKVWSEVSRPVQKSDKVVMDFKGFMNDEPFEGGEAKDFELEIGSNSMIPGFEDGIVGKEADKPFDLDITFPEDYQHKTLAGQKTQFKITIKKILSGTPAELNDDFAQKLGIKEGGIDALKKDITDNMTRELERRLSSINRQAVFTEFLKINKFDLPEALVDQEIEHLKHEMFHKIFGPKHTDGEKIPDFPRDLFEDKAKHRVHLGLLLSEYISSNNIQVSDELVNAKIEKLANAYEDPIELRKWYSKPENRSELEALVLEEMAADKIKENGSIVVKQASYDEVMNTKNDDDEGAE